MGRCPSPSRRAALATRARARDETMSAPVAVNAPVAGRPVPGRLAASRGPRALSSGRAVGPRPTAPSRGSTAARFGRARGTLSGIARASSSGDARAGDAPVSSDASDIGSLTDPDELDLLVALLPPRVAAILRAHPRRLALLEVVLDLGRVPIARFADGDERLGEDVIDYDDVARALENVGDIGGDNRAGVNRTLHRISVIRNRAGAVVGLTCRVGRAIRGSAELFRDLLASGRSVLLLGRPGVGKTTAIREISRVLSEEYGRRVVVVDTSNEIGGDGDVPHPGIGAARRMQVPRPDEQHHVLIEAVQNHTPEVIVVDEIGTELEAAAARTISQRGVQMIATAHGHTLENLLKNPTLNDLVGGVVSVTLGDDEARRRRVQKSVLEREGPPTFGAAVELDEVGRVRVHLDVGVAVDTLLAGYEPPTEMRVVDEHTGRVLTQPWLGSGAAASGGFGAMFGPGGPAGGGVGFGAAAADAAIAAPFVARDAILGGWGETGAAGPPRGTNGTGTGTGTGFARGMANGAAVARDSSSGLAAREVADAAAARAAREGASASAASDPASASADDSSERLFRIYPHELDCDVLEEVVESLGLTERVALTTVLEEAAAVLAVKSRVKGATWLRHAARVRGIPIYALKVEGMPQLARAIQAMLGLNNGLGSADEGDESNERAGLGAAGSTGFGSAESASSAESLSTATTWTTTTTAVASTPAEEADALEEVRMAVEQLVIPHQEPVELLPRDERLMAMQAALISGEYRLQYEECGEGAARRIRILHTYAA